MKLFPLYEGIHFTTSKKDIIDFNPDTMEDEVVDQKDVVKWEYTNDTGGRAYGVKDGNIGSITHMRAMDAIVPNRDDDSMKRKGFFKNLLLVLYQNGMKRIRISLQSQDTRGAIKRLMELGILHSPEAYGGISVDEHPTLLSIDYNKLKKDLEDKKQIT